MSASETAKIAAGTYVPDYGLILPSVCAWATQECREGNLAGYIKRFCESQQEIMDSSMVVVESVTPDLIECCIPCKCYDHESDGTFGLDIRFTLEPQTGRCVRKL